MQTVKIVYWEQDGGWIGHLQDYPDYWTQGETLEDLIAHLKDLYLDLTGGHTSRVERFQVGHGRSFSSAGRKGTFSRYFHDQDMNSISLDE